MNTARHINQILPTLKRLNMCRKVARWPHKLTIEELRKIAKTTQMHPACLLAKVNESVRKAYQVMELFDPVTCDDADYLSIARHAKISPFIFIKPVPFKEWRLEQKKRRQTLKKLKHRRFRTKADYQAWETYAIRARRGVW